MKYDIKKKEMLVYLRVVFIIAISRLIFYAQTNDVTGLC